MRVLHYGLSTNQGGIEAFILDLAQRLAGPEIRFDYVYNQTGCPPCYREELASLGANFYGLTPRRTSPRQNQRDLEAVFGSQTFDVFHCHLNTLSYAAPVLTALRHDVPVLIHSHNAGASRSLSTKLLHAINSRRVPLGRTTNVAVSRPAGRWLFGDSSPFQVINNGIDIERYRFDAHTRRRVREELGVGDALTLGHVGAFLPAKNHGFLLSVFRAVLDKQPDSRLVLVGAGPLESAVREQAEALGVSNRVHLLGRRSDVQDILCGLDALVFPSLHEGFPLTIVEAQASGLPCFISDHVTDEVVITPGAVRLPLTTPSEWAATVLSTPPVANRSVSAEALAAAGFGAEQVATSIASIYSELTTA